MAFIWGRRTNCGIGFKWLNAWKKTCPVAAYTRCGVWAVAHSRTPQRYDLSGGASVQRGYDPPASCGRLSVSQQTTNGRQAQSASGTEACVGMPQIVQARGAAAGFSSLRESLGTSGQLDDTGLRVPGAQGVPARSSVIELEMARARFEISARFLAPDI